ncbi:MAG: response regulator transcription factor [Planctomycetota bacterium]
MTALLENGAAAASATQTSPNELDLRGLRHWQSSTPPSVLIMEDDEDLQEGWRVFLRHYGYTVRSSSDGRQGFEEVVQDAPDVLLLDLGLPGMHGHKVLHQLRMHEQDSRIIVVTAEHSADNHQRAMRLGAHAVLAKPLDPNLLLGTIERLLDEG